MVVACKFLPGYVSYCYVSIFAPRLCRGFFISLLKNEANSIKDYSN